MKKRRNEEPIDEELLMRMMAGEKVRSDGNGGAEDTEEGENREKGNCCTHGEGAGRENGECETVQAKADFGL